MVERNWDDTNWSVGDTLTATELSNHSAEGHAEGEIYWEIDNGVPVIKDTTSDTIILRWNRSNSRWKLENAGFDFNSNDLLNAVLGTGLDADNNDIDNIAGIDIGTLKSNLDANGNDLTNVGAAGVQTLTSDRIDLKLAVDTPQTITGGDPINIDVSGTGVYEVTLDQNATVNLSGASSSGIYSVTVFFEDAGFTPTWDTAIEWEDGEAPSLNNDLIFIQFVSRDAGTTWYGRYSGVFQ